MALKSETLLRTPPLAVGGSSNNMNDDKTSEDLEDGEIFDDDDDDDINNENVAPDAEQNKSDVKTNATVTLSSNNNNNNNTKDNGADSVGLPLTASVTKSDNKNIKNEQEQSVPLWKNSGPTTGSDDYLKRNNLFSDDDKRSRDRRKKRRKRDVEGAEDDKYSKDKRLKKNSDKDVSDATVSNNDNNVEDNVDEDDDDDEMLFVRGASPTLHHNRKQSHDDDENDPYNDEDDDDFDDLDEDDDVADGDGDDNDDRRRGPRSNEPRLDRAARRERLLARGKRHGRGGNNNGPGNNGNKRRDDSEMCIFFLQGKCHKGSDCPFSHDAMPHKKMELCKFYLMDCCAKKDKCLYMHSEFPCKYYHMGLKCYANKNCKFSHGKLTDSLRQVFIKTFGPINNRGKEFPGKKGSSGKHRQQQDAGGLRDGRRDGNKREKKIPSLFDIKVSIPSEMRNHSDSEGGGNHTPMPSPPHLQQPQNMSDSSRSPPHPPPNVSPSRMQRRRRKERKADRLRKGGGQRDRRENSGNKQLSMMNNDGWDDGEHQRMQPFDNDDSNNNNNHHRDDLSNDDDYQYHHGGGSHHHHQEHNQYDMYNNKNDVGMHHDSPVPQDGDSGGLQPLGQSGGDSSNEMFPAHLPKKQRELFLRIKQQQRQASDTGSSGGRLQIDDSNEVGLDGCSDVSGENNTVVSNSNVNIGKIDNFNRLKPSDDQNWYSSDEDDEQQLPSGSNSITEILQNLVRLNNTNVSSPPTMISNNVFSNTQATSAMSMTSSSSMLSLTSAVATTGSGGINNINTAGISNVDFDIYEVSELLSKVKQHFQTSEKKVRDPRLRSDFGPSGDNQGGGSGTLNSTPGDFGSARTTAQNLASVTKNEDMETGLNANGGKGVGAGDMDLRNLPFKPAPVHSAATEIDASINSHSPLPYRLIPVVVAKPDYSTVMPNSKVGAADPRLRKSLRVSEESSSVVSSRDPRHRLIDDISKIKATVIPPVQNSDPRQRARSVTGVTQMNATSVTEDQQLPPSLLMSHIRPSYPLMPTPAPDLGMMCPPTPRLDDDNSPSYMPPVIPPVPPSARPTDPRQRHSQVITTTSNSHLPSLFDSVTAMSGRQPNFLTQTGDPRTRPPGITNIASMLFQNAVRSDDPVSNRGQYSFK